MSRRWFYLGALVSLVGVFLVPIAWAQQKPEREEVPKAQRAVAAVPDTVRSDEPTASPPGVAALAQGVPRLVKFSGTVKDQLGKPRTGLVGMTFAIYKDQEGGAPLWLETQNVTLDEQGRFTVLLGSTKNEGVPVELFQPAEPRWLGVQVNLPGEVEQPRVLLVSVPFALKAADAETLGGQPASAFLVRELESPSGQGAGAGLNRKTKQPTASKGSVGGKSAAPAVAGAIAANFIPVFTNNLGTEGSSVIFQDPATNNIGIGTTTPAAGLQLASGLDIIIGNVPTPAAPGSSNLYIENSLGDPKNSLRLDGFSNSLFIIGNSAAGATAGAGIVFRTGTAGMGETDRMAITPAGNVGIGTTGPTFKLQVNDTSNTGVRVVTATSGGTVASFGGFGDFQVDAPGVFGGRFIIKDATGNVGIGTPTPIRTLDVNGEIGVRGGNIFMQRNLTDLPGRRNWGWGTETFNVGDWSLFVSTSNISAPSVAVMTALSNGNVGIGTTNPTATFTVGVGGTTLADAWTVRSSARFKSNIQPITGALDKIEKLRGVSYDWRTNGKHDIGLIAEEVAQVVPEIVALEPNGKDAQGLDYARLTALLIEAVKEQQAQIKALQSELEELKAKLIGGQLPR